MSLSGPADISVTYNADTFSFNICQGARSFRVSEGYLGRILFAFSRPDEIDPNCTLFKTFRVTVDGEYLILSSSSSGQEVRELLKLSHSAAKRWSDQVTCVYGEVINSYSW